MPYTLARRMSSILLTSAAVFAACGGGSTKKAGPGGTGGGSTGGSSAAGTSSGGSSGVGTGGSGNVIALPDAGDSGLTADAGCGDQVFTGDRVPANMLFVVDRSGSMNCNLPEDGQTTMECETKPQKEDVTKPSKWELTRTAIKNAIDALQAGQPDPQNPDASVGVIMFPQAGTNCGVKATPDVTVSLLDDAQNGGIDSFLDTVSPEGSTPIAGATILGYNYMHTQLTLSGNKFVVLLTDGAETCKPEELPKLLGTDVPNASKVNIRTFVIGVPGSEDARALLSQIAWAGGTASDPGCTHDPAPADVGDCHFDMTQTQDFATDLANALDAISGSVLTCEFDIPTGSGVEVDFGYVNVKLNGKTIGKDEKAPSCDSADGWQYDVDPSKGTPKKILLCGPPCDEAKMPDAEVSIVLGCKSEIK